MKCLIDADILLYEIGYAAEASWRYSHKEKDAEWLEANPPPWEIVEELFLQRVIYIETIVGATEPSVFFLTGKTNFRNDIAKTKPYKARVGKKPFHYYNLKAYIKGVYEFQEQEGLEADDLLAIEQTAAREGAPTIICSRDKDLRAVAGWIYSWELEGIPSFGPHFVDGYGSISLSEDRKKLTGWGLKFFLAQCLTGDVVDTIPGLPKCGPVAAFEILTGTDTYEEGRDAVLEAYSRVYGDRGREELTEQGRLLWMTRYLVNGKPVMWDTYTTYDS